MTESINFGNQIKAALLEKNWQQKKLAEELGVSKSQVCHILAGKSNLTLETMVKMAAAVGLRVNICLEPVADSEYALAIDWQS